MATMIPNVIQNIFRRPQTRLYPLEVRKLPVGTRGHIDFDISQCSLCTLCSKRCPADAISVDRKSKTITFSPLQCIACGVCVQDCAKGAVKMYEQWSVPVTEINKIVYQKMEEFE